MKKTTLLLSTAILAIALAFSCGKSENSDNKAPNGEKNSASVCPEVSTVSVQSTNGGYPKEPIDWSSVKSSAAEWSFAGLGGDSKALTVYLSNYTFTPEQLLSYNSLDLQPGQGILILYFTNGQKDAAKGQYLISPKFDNPMRISAGIYVQGKVKVQFDDYKTEGSAEITELTTGKLCGKFSLKDPWSNISGSFTAPVAKSL